MAFRLQLSNFQNKYFMKWAYIYYDNCLLWRNMCWIWKKKTFTRLVFLLSNCLHILNLLNLCY